MVTFLGDRIKGLILRCHNTYCGAAAFHEMDHYILWIAAACGLQQHDLWLPQLPGWVEFSLPPRHNITPFISFPLLASVLSCVVLGYIGQLVKKLNKLILNKTNKNQWQGL